MHKIIEYIWDRPRVTKTTKKDGTQVVKVNENRQRKGVMVGFVEPDSDTVSIGVSLCCGLDKFDYKDGKKVKGFGLDIATERAKKHVDTEWVKVHGVTSIPQELRDQGDADGVWIKEVKLPASSVDNLIGFADRCTRYFKDKKMPVWMDVLCDEDIMGEISKQIKANNVSLEKYYMGLGCELCLDEDCPGC